MLKGEQRTSLNFTRMNRNSKRIDTFCVEFLLELSREEKVCEFREAVAHERGVSEFIFFHFGVEA